MMLARTAHPLPSRWPSWRRLLGRGFDDPARAEDVEALRQLDGVMGAAVHQLSPEHQLLVALRFGRGLTVAQVARLTHRSKEAVRMQQLLALRALQHELESHASG